MIASAFSFLNGGFVIPTVSACGFMDACGSLSGGRHEFFATFYAESCAAPGGELIDPRGLLTKIATHRYLL